MTVSFTLVTDYDGQERVEGFADDRLAWEKVKEYKADPKTFSCFLYRTDPIDEILIGSWERE